MSSHSIRSEDTCIPLGRLKPLIQSALGSECVAWRLIEAHGACTTWPTTLRRLIQHELQLARMTMLVGVQYTLTAWVKKTCDADRDVGQLEHLLRDYAVRWQALKSTWCILAANHPDTWSDWTVLSPSMWGSSCPFWLWAACQDAWETTSDGGVVLRLLVRAMPSELEQGAPPEWTEEEEEDTDTLDAWCDGGWTDADARREWDAVGVQVDITRTLQALRDIVGLEDST
jgi:hypothetical protein